MPEVALLQTRRDFATPLASTVERLRPEYAVDVYSQPQSIRGRLWAVLRHDYDLVQVDEAMRTGLVGAALRRWRSIPLVVCVRGWGDYTNDHGHHSALGHRSVALRSQFVFDRADHVVFVSEVCREMMRRRYRFGPSSVAPRPFDVERFRPASRPEGEETLRILTVTNLDYDQKARGVEIVLEGLEPIFDAYEDVEFVVAGGGRTLSDLTATVSSYPYRDRVELLGYREDVPALLSSADLFVYVSFLDSLSVVVLEAQAAGVPVVAAGTGGISEAVDDAGVLCPPTATGIARAVRRLVENPDERSALVAASYERIDGYNERAASKFLSVWDALL